MGRRQNRKKTKSLLIFSLVQGTLLVSLIYFWGENLLPGLKLNLTLGVYNQIVECTLPQLVYMENGKENTAWEDVTQTVLPSYAYHSKQLWYEGGNGEQFSKLAAAEEENYQARQEQLAAQENEVVQGEATSQETEEVQGEATSQGTEEVQGEQTTQRTETPQDVEVTGNLASNSFGLVKKAEVNRTKLQDFDYLRQNFYQIDSSTTADGSLLNVAKLLEKDVTITTQGDDPVILIYHTHSQEGYVDSKEGDLSTTVVGVGDYLTKLLTEKYGLSVLHHRGCYDVGDRDHAYSNAAPALEEILQEYPSIQVVIDLHRDGVPEDTHLVTEIDGKKMAKIMFFNGLSKTTTAGELSSLSNPYLADNLAVSFQMQLAAAEYYPTLTRRIYLKGYRYNMHYCPKSLLIEVGAQNNTLQEAMNAMEPLADVLALVLTGAEN